MLRRRHGGALGLPLHTANRCVSILNHMVQYTGSRLDVSFAALIVTAGMFTFSSSGFQLVGSNPSSVCATVSAFHSRNHDEANATA